MKNHQSLPCISNCELPSGREFCKNVVPDRSLEVFTGKLWGEPWSLHFSTVSWVFLIREVPVKSTLLAPTCCLSPLKFSWSSFFWSRIGKLAWKRRRGEKQSSNPAPSAGGHPENSPLFFSTTSQSQHRISSSDLQSAGLSSSWKGPGSWQGGNRPPISLELGWGSLS